jgi:HEAT repeat protein
MLRDWLADILLVLALIGAVLGIAESYSALGVSAYVPAVLFFLIIGALIIIGVLFLRLNRHFAQQDKPSKNSYEAPKKPFEARIDDRNVNRETAELKHGQPSVAGRVVESQGKIGNGGDADSLELALRDDNLYVRMKAVEELRSIETDKAVDVLKQALCDHNSRVREEAAAILSSRGWMPKNDVEQAYYLIAQSDWNELIILGEPAVKPLIKALDYEFDPSDQGKAAEALGNIGGPVACEALIQALNSPDWFPRQAAAASLGKTRDQRALEPLIKVLTDPHWSVRLRAAESLGKLHFAKAKKPLTQVLTDQHSSVRREAANSLGDLDWIPDTDTERAFYYIATLRFSEVVRLGEPAVQPLIQILRTDLEEAIEKMVMSALVEIAREIGEPAISPLIEALKDPIGRVRSSIAVILEQVGKPAVPFLMRAREDEDPNVREGALKALARIDYLER